jgi:hypothetical protein
MHASALRPLATAAALFFAFCASGADETAPVAKPQVKVGDRWTYRLTNYMTPNPTVVTGDTRVASTGTDEILMVSKRRDRAEETDNFYTSEWNSVSVGVWTTTPHNGLFKFPLKVGDSYKAEYEATQKGTGVRGKVEVVMKVVGWEDVTVPAGKFRALKIEGTGSYIRRDQRGFGWNRYDYWYVPEIKRWVKSAYKDGAEGSTLPNTSNGVELVEFSVQ